MKKRFLMSLSLLLFTACWSNFVPDIPQGSPEEIIVRANAQAVQTAAEAFFMDGAEYPDNVDSHKTNSGQTLIDLLPEGMRLVNPYTGERTEPVNGTAPSSPGEIAYAPDCPPCGWNYGFTVSGHGDTEAIVTLTDAYLEKEAVVEAHCQLVQKAAEAFAADNGGQYPSDTSVDAIPSGDTLIDLLPDGTLLENPFTLAATEPANGAAATPGQVGYVVITGPGGSRDGYVITGWGKSDTIVVLDK
jgi:hypothetical protein